MNTENGNSTGASLGQRQGLRPLNRVLRSDTEDLPRLEVRNYPRWHG